MSERIRLTIAAAATTLLLAAVSIAGLGLHPGSPAPARSAPIAPTTQTVHPAPTSNWHEEYD